MKVFDYTTSRVEYFLVNVTLNVTCHKQMTLASAPQSFLLRQAQSVGYVEVMTRDKNGHLITRDKCVLVGDGAVVLKMPEASRVDWHWCSLYHLATDHHENPNTWSRSKRVQRYHR